MGWAPTEPGPARVWAPRPRRASVSSQSALMACKPSIWCEAQLRASAHPIKHACRGASPPARRATRHRGPPSHLPCPQRRKRVPCKLIKPHIAFKCPNSAPFLRPFSLAGSTSRGASNRARERAAPVVCARVWRSAGAGLSPRFKLPGLSLKLSRILQPVCVVVPL